MQEHFLRQGAEGGFALSPKGVLEDCIGVKHVEGQHQNEHLCEHGHRMMVKAMLQMILLGQFPECLVFNAPAAMPHAPNRFGAIAGKLFGDSPYPLAGQLLAALFPSPVTRLFPLFLGGHHTDLARVAVGEVQIIDFPQLHLALLAVVLLEGQVGRFAFN